MPENMKMDLERKFKPIFKMKVMDEIKKLESNEKSG
jgi:hypothetical protein